MERFPSPQEPNHVRPERGEIDFTAEQQEAPAPAPENPQIEQGIREHGNAFRAYLQLPDIDHSRDDLLETFQECYVDSFTSKAAMLTGLTEVSDWEHDLQELTERWGIDGIATLNYGRVENIARQMWDIVEVEGSFHAFTK